MEAAANPSRCGAPLLLTANDPRHGFAAEASLLCLPGCVATSHPEIWSRIAGQGEDGDRDLRRPDLDLASNVDAPHKSKGPPCLSGSKDVDDQGPRSSPMSETSSMTRSSVPTTMIRPRTRSLNNL